MKWNQRKKAKEISKENISEENNNENENINQWKWKWRKA